MHWLLIIEASISAGTSFFFVQYSLKIKFHFRPFRSHVSTFELKGLLEYPDVQLTFDAKCRPGVTTKNSFEILQADNR